jgi:hypothetical protein
MKNLFLLALLISFSPAAFAEGKAAIGVQGGLTFPDFHVKNSTFASQYGNKDGWLVGLYGEIGLWTITFRPELNYVTKGYTVANTAEVNNRYLEIPLLLKFNPFGDFFLSPFIVVGPQWSYHMSTDTTLANTTVTYTNTADKSDLSGVAGLGLEFNISEGIGANFQGRYSFGLRDVDDTATEVRTRAFYAIVGLSMRNAF